MRSVNRYHYVLNYFIYKIKTWLPLVNLNGVTGIQFKVIVTRYNTDRNVNNVTPKTIHFNRPFMWSADLKKFNGPY